MAGTLKKLEGFGTRYILSAQDDPSHGIGAAKRWIHDELAGYSPRLRVATIENYRIKMVDGEARRFAMWVCRTHVAVLPGVSPEGTC